MVKGLLSRLGYQGECVRNPREAVERFRADPGYAVVITDYSMPEMSGIDVARALSQLRPDVKVVLTSGNLPPELTEAAVDAGVVALMHKQNTLEELAPLLVSLTDEVMPPPQKTE